MLLADYLQVTAVAGVADEQLVAPLELTRERGDDRGAIGGILFRFLVVAANDAASPGQHHRLGLIAALRHQTA